MNGSSILKKVLPILCSILLIIIITVTASAIKNNNLKAPAITDGDADYITLTETIDGKKYTYSVSKNEVYAELKNGIGLSSVITMINKELLKKEIYEGTTSYWDAVSEDDIKEQIDTACYGEDVDKTTLSTENKAEKEEKFTDTMYTGYGYNCDAGIYSTEIMDHYRLISAKKLYAKVALHKEVTEPEDADKPYFDDDKIDTYYDEHYDKTYWAIIIPFSSSEAARTALQQTGVTNNYTYIDSALTTETKKTISSWHKYQLQETSVGSGAFEPVYDRITETQAKENAISAKEVIETFIKVYNTVYASQPEKQLKEGTATLNEDGSYAFSEGCDYAVVSFEAQYTEGKNAIAALKTVLEGTGTADDKVAEINKVIEKINKVRGTALKETDALSMIEALQNVRKAIETADSSVDPLTAVNDLIAEYDSKKVTSDTIVFNVKNTESPIHYEYSDLYAYDSTLPSKLNNSMSQYIPYWTSEKTASVNTTDATWYTKTPVSSSSVYYLMLYVNSTPVKELADVKDEIITKLEEEALTDTLIETKMAQLREDYNIVIYDNDIESGYISNAKTYSITHKDNKKKNDTVIAKVTKDDYSYELTADKLFTFMEKTSGRSTAISELAYQRLLNNSLFNKYKDTATGEWLGDEGKELKETILNNIETQRLNFLSGAYSSYGYSTSSMTWEEFMYQVNGATSEQNLAQLLLYGSVSSDYINSIIDFVDVEGEDVNLTFKMSYNDAELTKGWDLLYKRMQDVINKSFSVNGEHLLVSVYESVNNAISGTDPLDPSKWTDDQKTLANELLNDVRKYLQYADGTYATKLQAVVTAFNNCPYAVKDASDKYVTVIDSNNEQYKYYLTCPGVSIDLAKYKSAGLTVKYESLGTFTEGKMVENFENAAKEIWAADKAMGNVTDNITVYNKNIETEFGYHLYVNLGSTFATTYTAKDIDTNGNVVEVKDQVTPTLYEIRLNNQIKALEAIDQTDMNDEEKKAITDKVAELKENLSSEASTAITTYYDTVVGELTGNYFTAIHQQNAIKALFADTNSVKINGSQYNANDFIKMIDVNYKVIYRDNMTYLKAADELEFDITANFTK